MEGMQQERWNQEMMQEDTHCPCSLEVVDRGRGQASVNFHQAIQVPQQIALLGHLYPLDKEFRPLLGILTLQYGVLDKARHLQPAVVSPTGQAE